MAYVSVTGFTVHGLRHLPGFLVLSVLSMRQAQRAEGCLSAEARRVGAVFHTLSVWESREAMLAYLRKGPHGRAMTRARRIGHGKVLGFDAEEAPSWEVALCRWHAEGRAV